MRIIYPNGSSEWTPDQIFAHMEADCWDRPCWDAYQESKNGYDALKKMREYDKEQKFRKAEFIGEIK